MKTAMRDRQVLCIAVILVLCITAGAQNVTRTIQERLGYPATARLLIIHADDLGMAHSVNRAIFEALEKHWVSSASILVVCPWLPEVASWAKQHPDADLGIHLALNSEWTTFRWGPVSPQDQVSSLLDPQGYMPLLEEQVVDHAKPQEVERELRAQIERAQQLGITISHLDPHMGTLLDSAPLLEVYRRVGHEFNLPLRLTDSPDQRIAAAVSIPADEQLLGGVFQMQPGVSLDEWFDYYKKTLTPLKPGVYQLVVHLAYDDPEMRAATAAHPDWGAEWRQTDFDTISSPQFSQFLKTQGFVLISWRELAKVLPEGYSGRK